MSPPGVGHNREGGSLRARPPRGPQGEVLGQSRGYWWPRPVAIIKGEPLKWGGGRKYNNYIVYCIFLFL